MGRIGAVEPVKRVRRATAQRAPKRPPTAESAGSASGWPASVHQPQHCDCRGQALAVPIARTADLVLVGSSIHERQRRQQIRGAPALLAVEDQRQAAICVRHRLEDALRRVEVVDQVLKFVVPWIHVTLPGLVGP